MVRIRMHAAATMLLGALGASAGCFSGAVSRSGSGGAGTDQDASSAGSGGSDVSGAGGATGAGGTTPTGAGGAVGAGGSGAGGRAAGSGGRSGAGGAVAGSGGAAGAGVGGGSCTEPPPASDLIGWASQSGMGQNAPTTGGGSATPTPVSTAAAFNSNAAGTAMRVLYVTGSLTGDFAIGSNKTIVGLCGAEIHGHIDVSRSSNVIVRNLKIVGYGVGDCSLDPSYTAMVGCSSGADAVTIQNGSHHIWFDHCDISDGTDGNLDTTSGSDFVTISWTKFHYTPRTDNVGNDSTGAEGHRFSNLIGSADGVMGDVGHLNITFHHDWWADNVNQRMPRSRYGKIHILNNLYTAAGDSYCTNAGLMASLLVENNVYSGVKAPLQVTMSGDMLARGNSFPNSTGTTTATGMGFVPPYTYTADPTDNLAATIMSQAGPH